MKGINACSYEEFLACFGVGEARAARYGDIFLTAIAEYLAGE